MTSKKAAGDVLALLAAKRAEAEARLTEVLNRHNEAEEKIRDLQLDALDDPQVRGEIVSLERRTRELRREREWLEATLAEIGELEALEAARDEQVARRGSEASARARMDERLKLAKKMTKQMTVLAETYQRYDALAGEIVDAWPDPVRRNASPFNSAAERDQLRVGAVKLGLGWLVNGGAIPESILDKRPDVAAAAKQNAEQFIAAHGVDHALPSVSERLKKKMRTFYGAEEICDDA
ncbi:MAG: hypothetical protein AAF563_12365 [Pseudomonadota bacterium]